MEFISASRSEEIGAASVDNDCSTFVEGVIDGSDKDEAKEEVEPHPASSVTALRTNILKIDFFILFPFFSKIEKNKKWSLCLKKHFRQSEIE